MYYGASDRKLYDSGIAFTNLSLFVSDVGRQVLWGEKDKRVDVWNDIL